MIWVFMGEPKCVMNLKSSICIVDFETNSQPLLNAVPNNQGSVMRLIFL